jgi:predicted nucleotidyltransferase
MAPAEWPALQVEELLRALDEHGVDFVVIGGIAAVLHGSATLTQDLDVCFATNDANLRRLGDTLMALGARLAGLDDDLPFTPDAATLRRVEVLTLVTDRGKLDVLARPVGAPRYETLRRRAERFDIGGLIVLVATLEDLIAMKEATGRDKDRAAVTELRAIKRLRERDAGSSSSS